MVEIFSLHIVFAGIAVADMHGEPAVLIVQRCEIFFHDVLVGVSHPVKEMHITLEAVFHHCLQHTQHRGQTDPSPNENDGGGFCDIEKKISTRCFDIEDVELVDMVMEKIRRFSWWHIIPAARWGHAFDGYPVVLFVSDRGKRVTPGDLFVARNIELKCQKLTWFKRRKWSGVVWVEVKGTYVAALELFFLHLEFSKPLPGEGFLLARDPMLTGGLYTVVEQIEGTNVLLAGI